MLFSRKLIDSRKYLNELAIALNNVNDEMNIKLTRTLKYLGNHKNDMKEKEGVELFHMIYQVVEAFNTKDHNQNEKDELVNLFSSLLICSKVDKPTMIQLALVSSKKFEEAVRLYYNNSDLVKKDAMKKIFVVTAINNICSEAVNLKTKRTPKNEFSF